MTFHTTLERPQRRRTDAPPSWRPRRKTIAWALSPQDTERVRTRINFWIAIVALVLLTPLMLMIAIAIKLTSKGPIIYSQPRVGLDRRRDGKSPSNYRRVKDLGGLPFRIYKFRTMTADAEKDSGVVWASKDDSRITWVGRILRKARLDELPQFFNVLRGEMSVVGPRPERPAIFANLKGQVEKYHVRQRALPGITGLAQISQAYDTSIEDVRSKVEHDLEYIQHQCIKEDLRIMLKTIPVVLFRRGGW